MSGVVLHAILVWVASLAVWAGLIWYEDALTELVADLGPISGTMGLLALVGLIIGPLVASGIAVGWVL